MQNRGGVRSTGFSGSPGSNEENEGGEPMVGCEGGGWGVVVDVELGLTPPSIPRM